MTTPEQDAYILGIKNKAYLWLAERCVAGQPNYKASDVKSNFMSISSAIIDRICEVLVEEGKATIEGRGRVSLYVLDEVKARKALPVPEVVRVVPKVVKVKEVESDEVDVCQNQSNKRREK